MAEETERHSGFFMRVKPHTARQLERYAYRHGLTRGLAARKVLEEALEKWAWNEKAAGSFPRVLDRRRL
jgi:hypothetical protein